MQATEGRGAGAEAMSGLYSTTRWRKQRLWFLARNPLCAMHQARGMTVLADTVDHITPHRGDQQLFFDPGNWQPLCRSCHSMRKQQVERSGFDAMPNADGSFSDARHPFNKPQGRGGR